MVKYDIAFSYASEQNLIVEEYKAELQNMGLKVFVDSDHAELLAFQHVSDVLKPIYEDEDIAMVIFLSEDYVSKNFTKYESRIAFDRLLRGHRLEIIRIDDAVLPWLTDSVHYFDIRKNNTNFICDALYRAIKGDSLLNIDVLFIELSEFICQNCVYLRKNISSQGCIIFKLIKKENAYIKINCVTEDNRIEIFYCSSHVEAFFSIAEIHRNEKDFTFLNKGIIEAGTVFMKFADYKKLLNFVLEAVNCFEVLL